MWFFQYCAQVILVVSFVGMNEHYSAFKSEEETERRRQRAAALRAKNKKSKGEHGGPSKTGGARPVKESAPQEN